MLECLQQLKKDDFLFTLKDYTFIVIRGGQGVYFGMKFRKLTPSP